MAFQLVDDILDFTSTEKILGKPSGNDLREGKVTLPLIYALEGASPAEKQMVETILADSSYENVPFMQIIKMIEHHKSIQRSYERARAFTEKADSLIASFPDSPAQRALRDIVDLVTDREA